MRFLGSPRMALACFVVLFLTTAVDAVPVTFSGTVTYNGSYSADSFYVAVIDTTDNMDLLGYVALPAGSPPFSLPYVVEFDNAWATIPLWLVALLDADSSGIDPDSLDNAYTNSDILGWYGSQPDPIMIPPDVSQSGLDFFLPTAEIHGTLTFGTEQTDTWVWARSEGGFETASFTYDAAGHTSAPYELRGVYAGDWYVMGAADCGSAGDKTICYGDPTCQNPTLIHLNEGQVLVGIDFDFRPCPVEETSWGRIKHLYR
jgi:hypothetical protein